jgi:hypothetical protein
VIEQISKVAAGRRAFCLSCGWAGHRRREHQARPCAKCQGTQVVLQGMAVPIPRDPVAVAAALRADSELYWQVLRELGDTSRIVGPWAPFPSGYWERATLVGQRVAWIRPELGGQAWQTEQHSGHAETLGAAMTGADAALVGWLESDWNLVGSDRWAS